MNVSIFGNPDLPEDAMPIALLPDLRKKFPEIDFVHQDPNELNEAPSNPWIIIDTIKGINKVQVVSDIGAIKVQSRVSMHDYDLSMHLALLKKINPQLEVRIVGIPFGATKEEVMADVTKTLASLLPKSD